ncbi:uncharacterized protein LOC142231217 [Haematobia irritans]|uniref:uncharacterized protein LOC142231217 n=1 Tax=Haematobia irritans TaxID=7368 RepID=UPI003F50CEF4
MALVPNSDAMLLEHYHHPTTTTTTAAAANIGPTSHCLSQSKYKMPYSPSKGQEIIQKCAACPNPPNDQMLECISCHKRYHLTCSKSMPNEIFKCQNCASNNSDVSSPNSSASVSSRISNTSTRYQPRQLQLELQRLEEERAVSMNYISRKYKLLQEHEEMYAANEASSHRSVHNWVQDLPSMQNTSDLAHPDTDQEPIADTRFSDPNETTMAQASCLHDETVRFNLPPTMIPTTASNNIYQTSRSDPTLHNETHTGSAPLPPSDEQTISDSTSHSVTQNNIEPQLDRMQWTSTWFPPLAPTSAHPSNNDPNICRNSSISTQQNRITNTSGDITQNRILYSSPILNSDISSYAPNTSQLQARNSLPKELPSFSGLPEEWPLFYSTFQWSTKMCGFNDAENLLRLQKALAGDALKNVQHLLIHPSNVSWVVSVLKLLYGQPEKILHSIKSRIKLTPSVDENNIQSFTTFAINVKSLIATIEASDMVSEINNSTLLSDLLQKLPASYQMQWGCQKLQLINQNKTPNMHDFCDWIFNIGISASCITVDSSTGGKRSVPTSSYNNNRNAYIHAHDEERRCFVCNGNRCRTVSNCQKYLSLQRGERWNIVRKYSLCRICLCKHSGECKKKTICGVDGCQFLHHSSLHRHSSSQSAVVSEDLTNENVNNNSVINNMEVINNAHCNSVREGSSISLMDEQLLTQLDISGQSNPLCLKWTGGIDRCERNSQRVTITISGETGSRFTLNVATVRSINLPTQTLDYDKLARQYNHLRNLPIKSYHNASPQILIGLNHFKLGMSTKMRLGKSFEPVAVRTQIGWMIYGPISDSTETSKHFNYHLCECNVDNRQLDELVKSFYEIDSLGISLKDPLLGKYDERAMNLLKLYTKQRKDGHYEVPYLWKFDTLNLPDSYLMAKKRLVCLEKKFKNDPKLYEVFKTTIENYISKGYVRKISDDKIDHGSRKVWYLPIFAVFNKNKPGKSRVVWDAAAVSSGVSLNSFLLKGPDMFASLPAVLFSFRQRAIAFSGDIEEMFHQIYIRPEDREVQRFLWRDCNTNIEPQVYLMDVMIFGAVCAPSISQYVKNLNADKYCEKFPKAAKIIKENHYVDDLLYSVDTSQEAAEIIKEVQFIHRKAGFNIRNWICNSQDVINSICGPEGDAQKSLNLFGGKDVEKVLGVFWQHKEDLITFKLSPSLMENCREYPNKIPTKRKILRLVMSIYDPLGLIGNIIMYVKILLQEVWRAKIDWDQEIPGNLMVKWTQWLNVLPSIEAIKIPRCYLQTISPNYVNLEVQLHMFVDASKDGYAAVCYLRLRQDSNIKCSLVGSKTRVAPIKITSVPRLELMAALIGARFARFICENHQIHISKKFFWSDSKTVLSWINSDHRNYSQFVAFRISEILELTSGRDWYWTPTKHNVADDATKWARIPNVSLTSRWFKGPQFLYDTEDKWPKGETSSFVTTEEMSQPTLVIASSQKLINEFRFSKWNRMLRAVAYSMRFVKNCREKIRIKGELSQEELLKAEICLYRQAQHERYSSEILCLAARKAIPKTSEIFNKCLR